MLMVGFLYFLPLLTTQQNLGEIDRLSKLLDECIAEFTASM